MRQRASSACDFCHGRGLRCRSDPQQSPGAPCLTCRDYGAKCTRTRPVRRRGRKPATRALVSPSPEPSGTNFHSRCIAATQGDFRCLSTIRRLLNIYVDTMYQCYFPFLPEQDLITRWAEGIPDASTPSYVLLMSLCAVSSQSAALHAVFDESLLEGHPLPASEQYFEEAVSRIPMHMPQQQHDLDFLRAFGLLAAYSLLRGNHSELHRYLGLYHALVAQCGFHDESRWPADITMSDVDERRRLFWCVYRLEIHSACVLGHVVRLPEAQVSVMYPRITPAMSPETQAWTAGWDYITDLFRLLEYAIFSLRGCKNRRTALAIFCDKPSPTTLLDGLARLKANKPHMLHALTVNQDDDSQSNRCKYMAVQILCTETLVNIMALLYCKAPAREVMDVAESFLEELTNASLIFFKIAGSQIVHQLLGVGRMLHNASHYEHGQHRAEAKRLIVFIGDLVKNLENDIPSAIEAAEQLHELATTAYT
ncbi:uncharacterized protein B0I36DRAFT_365262 [Microdochium trichocladiopsis]|uniref:Xylanolytic transcriptional activator regulatory domain-containing protein n=1 Tax=Microdochium trichocladiopsis TaxID=1682393 RepID=A0A9P8Y2T7_9PEZI|nr:uncharacterized protein B0I36DRAFT_365262 [Microdochium trichocladiopsis]KAH7028155.1 hypothetical protein B0I36DRAFT_365262 [Microdochium trichocladiopsis]